MIFGYATVWTQEQNLDGQLEALIRAEAEQAFSEKVSGKDAKRPEHQALMSQLRAGDVVTVTKYDRLSRSLPDLLRIVSEIEAQGADFRPLAEQIDTTTRPDSWRSMSSRPLAQFGPEKISERTN